MAGRGTRGVRPRWCACRAIRCSIRLRSVGDGRSRITGQEFAMPIQLDHGIVPSRDRKAAARLLASLLDVPWSEDTPAGPFSPVYVNDELTLDVGQMGECTAQH